MRRQGDFPGSVPPGLATPVQDLKGVGPRRAEALARLGVRTVEEVLYLLPLRHEDRSHLKPITALRPGGHETVVGEVRAVSLTPTRRVGKIVSVIIGDGTGTMVVKWFHQPYLRDRFRRGMRFIFSGRVGWGHGLEMVNPDYEEWDGGGQLHAGRIVPIYPLTEGLSPRWMRSFMQGVVEEWTPKVEDFLPEEICHRHQLLPLSRALRVVHFPDQAEEAEQGKRRLAFDDLFLLSLGLAWRRKERRAEETLRLTDGSALVEAVRRRLAFPLTAAQERVLREITTDLGSGRPMHRLLQGDVGSGKTAVAVLAMVQAIGSGCQGAIMAPTEILAEQHYLRARGLLEPLGIRVGLLTGSILGEERERLLGAIDSGEVDLVIGTHALIQEEVSFHRLGLVIVDEQHRFGVRQRADLKAKGGRPHVLVMTATPIPRTLALTLYGDLELSVIDEMPPGRRPVKTELIPEGMRPQVYRRVAEEIRRGGAAYIICPLVEEGEEADVKAATSLAVELRQGIFQEFRVGCLHGRMRAEEKAAAMEAFRCREVDVLVTTTVVEVGVDVPHATVVVVEHAERLGLSQLHQIRGRVGRAQVQASCLLIHSHDVSEEGRARLQAMVECADGFQIAERDLELRGPGELFGIRQSGLPDLKVAHLLRDAQLLDVARREALALLQTDPALIASPALRDALARRWQGGLALATVG